MALLSFLLCIIASVIIIDAQQQMKLHLLSEGTVGGLCLDGSPAGVYYSPPPSGSSDLWIISLEGGGACHDKQSCLSRANSSLGSSTYWSPTRSAGHSALSDVPSINPDFYSGHHAFLPYCSGDVWTGMRITPSTNPDSWGLYFSGHLILENIMNYLGESLGCLDAKYVLMTGGSAGGLGTFMNVNWLYYELREEGTYGDNITVKAAPVAGWFFAGNTTDQLSNPMMPPNDYSHWTHNETGGEGHDNSINVLWDSYLPRECTEALSKTNNSWHCGSVHNVYPYIDVPIFVMENKFDTNQLEAQFGLPKNIVNAETIGYVSYFGMDMDRSIITQMVDEKNDKNEKNGLFYASCFDHGGGIGIGIKQSSLINGYNSSELVGDWFWERNKLPHFVYDTCNNDKNQLPCNPTCNSYPPKNV